MKQYESYKPSGVEFIGDIPEHWEVRKLKYIMNIIRTGTTPDTKNEEYFNGDINWFKPENLNESILNFATETVTQLALDNNKVKMLQKDSILVVGIGATSGKTAYLNVEASFNQQITGFHSLENCNKYYYYIFENFKLTFLQLASYTTLAILNNEFFKSFIVPLPPLHEQEKIANFLDTKNQQIEEFIKEKQNQIALLQEQKEAIINKAVTKGLDNSIQMKDSGIEWIGDIPEHWKVRKLQFLGQLQNGINIGAEYFGSGYPFVSYVDVNKNISLPPLLDGLVQSSISDRENYSVEEGDVLFTRTSETIEEIGFASTCLTSIDNATFAGFLIRFRPYDNILNSNFSKYYFRSQLHRVFFTQEMNIVTRASLSQGLLKLLPTLLPPMDEQGKIAKYLDVELAKTTEVITQIQKEIDLIKEYKISLISEVVTGQIDVR